MGTQKPKCVTIYTGNAKSSIYSSQFGTHHRFRKKEIQYTRSSSSKFSLLNNFVNILLWKWDKICFKICQFMENHIGLLSLLTYLHVTRFEWRFQWRFQNFPKVPTYFVDNFSTNNYMKKKPFARLGERALQVTPECR